MGLQAKKPVNFGFLDYSTLERRRNFCHEEFCLNRRMVPDVYVEVVPLVLQDGQPRFEGCGGMIRHSVACEVAIYPQILGMAPDAPVATSTFAE